MLLLYMQDEHSPVCLRNLLTRQIVPQVKKLVSYQILRQLKVHNLQRKAHLLMLMQRLQGGGSSRKSGDIQAMIPMTQV